jgi:hypothetical protein
MGFGCANRAGRVSHLSRLVTEDGSARRPSGESRTLRKRRVPGRPQSRRVADRILRPSPAALRSGRSAFLCPCVGERRASWNGFRDRRCSRTRLECRDRGNLPRRAAARLRARPSVSGKGRHFAAPSLSSRALRNDWVRAPVRFVIESRAGRDLLDIAAVGVGRCDSFLEGSMGAAGGSARGGEKNEGDLLAVG